ncbi:MAG TPA: TolC family protein [Opitutaceae bacterium]
MRKKSLSSQPTLLAKSTVICLTAAAMGLAGCTAIAPKPFSNDELRSMQTQANDLAFKDVAPITHPISLEEALARAFKYNLNQRAQMMEEAIALNVWDAGRYDLLPRALATAGYHSRNSDLITRSQDSVTGQPSLAHPYISSDRTYESTDLGFSWSVLDFTVGYFNAKQNADRALIALEHRRKAMHTLGRDVTVAFWRMASAQRLVEDVKHTISSAESALNDAAQAQGLRSPADSLRYQRQLVENLRLLSSIEKEFSSARLTLATLINAPVGQDFIIVEPEAKAHAHILDVSVEHMEEAALLQNADLKEQAYNERIALQEVHKSIAKLLPNLSFDDTLRHSTDSFLINKNWNEAGILLSQNLSSLLSAPANMHMAKAGVDLAKERRIAAQMALIAQVRIARLEVFAAYQQLEYADRIWALDDRLDKLTADREEAQADSRLAKISADTSAIVSRLRRYQALADYEAAVGALQSTLGLQINLGSVNDLSLEDLIKAIGEWEHSWDAGQLPDSNSQGVVAKS